MDNSFSPTATDFVIFAIESTAKRLDISGRRIYLALKNIDGIRGFLYPSYPMLHTQSKEYIVDEVLGFLKEHSSDIIKEKIMDGMKENPSINSTLLQLKYSHIIKLLAKRLGVGIPQAMDVFYTSQLYEDLSNPDNHLHNMSDLYLADSIMLELQQK